VLRAINFSSVGGLIETASKFLEESDVFRLEKMSKLFKRETI